ncbi:MAG: Lrp/AsnC family transcriptional regulator [Candidatus Lokiarchaeota archaeon]|nr:Lrp/AsnC family transcriptional regulator [Candidatus Lokiarchaeota archaeon]
MPSIAFVLLQVKAGKMKDVLKEIKKIKQIKEAYSITGPKDIIMKIETEQNLETIAKLVVTKVHEISGVINSETYFVVNI